MSGRDELTRRGCRGGRSYRPADEPDAEDVPKEEQVDGYRYGKDVVRTVAQCATFYTPVTSSIVSMNDALFEGVIGSDRPR